MNRHVITMSRLLQNAVECLPVIWLFWSVSCTRNAALWKALLLASYSTSISIRYGEHGIPTFLVISSLASQLATRWKSIRDCQKKKCKGHEITPTFFRLLLRHHEPHVRYAIAWLVSMTEYLFMASVNQTVPTFNSETSRAKHGRSEKSDSGGGASAA